MLELLVELEADFFLRPFVVLLVEAELVDRVAVLLVEVDEVELVAAAVVVPDAGGRFFGGRPRFRGTGGVSATAALDDDDGGSLGAATVDSSLAALAVVAVASCEPLEPTLSSSVFGAERCFLRVDPANAAAPSRRRFINGARPVRYTKNPKLQQRRLRQDRYGPTSLRESRAAYSP